MVKNKLSKFYITGAVLILLIILTICFNAFYLKKVTIYEPIAISVSGLTYGEQRTISVCCTTPLNRKADIYYSNSEMDWRCYYSFIKSVEMIIPDTIYKKIASVEVVIGTTRFKTGLQCFQSERINNFCQSYHLPPWIRSEKSFFKMIESVFYWQYVQFFLKILLLIIISMFLFIKKFRKIILSVLFFLPLENNRFFSKILGWIVSKRNFFKWVIIFSLSLFIAFSLFYGYIFFKYTVVTLTTLVLFIIWFCLLVFLILGVIIKLFKISKANSRRIFVVSVIILVLWICFESFLRKMDVNSSYNERIGLFYSSGFIVHDEDVKEDKGLWVHPKYSERIYKRKEFSDDIKCNADGLRDVDHPLKKDTGEYRIICLGNSFTEGIGTMQDSSWPKQLEKRLNKNTKRKFTVFNAGMSGSDPFFEYMLLEKKMLNYNPNLVLVALGSSDFGFYRFRGGFERFTSDGYRFRKAPSRESLYALSYIYRLILNNIFMYDNLLSPAEQNDERIKSTSDIEECINRFVKLSHEKHFDLRIIFIDDGGDKYFPLIYKLTKQNKIPIFNMFKYNNDIEKLYLSDRSKYYWPQDGHCNSKGYGLIAKGVEWYLIKTGIIDSLKIE